MDAFFACSAYHADLRLAVSAPPQQRVHFLLIMSRHEEIDDTGDPLLPDLDLVRQDVAMTSAVWQEAIALMPERPVLELQDPYTGENVQEPASRSLVLKLRLPWLFMYSFLIHHSDVPEDIHEHVIWALEMYIDALIHCTDVQLVTLYKDEIGAMFYLRQQAKAKITLFLLKPEIDRPREAVQYFSEIIDFRQRSAVDTSPSRVRGLTQSPGSCRVLGVARHNNLFLSPYKIR
ncbi:uncharacterized protein B0H18DRAFT_1034326 [Fomitopsis serialis]|uniref:uncharacterized protein n=1 Tax=Fomitopsis serialis TaxID=139415 RepID=UPI002007C985|nr:uncharacterized protein B0H18DRAFT_1034326 [Neoantrodia serialis]KAH9917483.1 hypothetical protein B0H18DRAFT_1034326 [Neoantrodia serialis]